MTKVTIKSNGKQKTWNPTTYSNGIGGIFWNQWLLSRIVNRPELSTNCRESESEREEICKIFPCQLKSVGVGFYLLLYAVQLFVCNMIRSFN